MSVSDEFRRLLLHARDRLAEEDASIRAALSAEVKNATNGYIHNQAVAKLTSYVAASTYAGLVMEMTAKFLVADDDAAVRDTPAAEGGHRA